jgi:hypothetical protein
MGCTTCGKKTNIVAKQAAIPMSIFSSKKTIKPMANENNPHIMCWRGKQRWPYHYSVLIGAFLERIEKAHGKIEIDDPDLNEKLTEEQLKALSANFPHLDPDRPLPIAPPIIDVEFRLPVDALGEVEPVTEETPQAAKRGRKPRSN